jgi:hypothetical protein
MPPELRDAVTVVGLDDMRSGDARVHWASGHARRQPAEVWHCVMQALHPALADGASAPGAATTPTPTHPDPAGPAAKDSQDGE